MAIRAVAHGLIGAFLVGCLFIGGTGTVAAAEPTGYEYFHTYAESVASIDAAVANHRDIAQKLSIGDSYLGRPIVGVKLTADVAAGNHGRPEILIDALMHARERATAEMAIYMIGLLAENYGRATRLGRRVTAILDSTVVYVIPMLNPDGAVYDFKGGAFHRWRKNRQPIPNSAAIGVDLNRQFGFKWACCGGSSDDPFAEDYHGPSAWFAPEAVALRQFIESRVVDGTQRITEELSLHSAARRVLWPFGYTYTDVPSTMTADDHATFVALGKGVGSRNGYSAEQSSDLYITDGDAGDWAYRHGVFSIVIEMAKGSAKRYYPTQSELDADIARNRPAILWFIEQAGCPYAAAGLAAGHCATTMSTSAARMASSYPK